MTQRNQCYLKEFYDIFPERRGHATQGHRESMRFLVEGRVSGLGLASLNNVGEPWAIRVACSCLATGPGVI